MSDDHSRLPAVDGLRGLAILLVIYQHSVATAVGQRVMRATGWDFPYIVANAWMGVSLFFVLSGFVLALPYFSGARAMRSRVDVLRFLKHRAGRLVPLFVFMALVSLAFTIAAGRPGWQSLLMTLTTASMFTREQFFPAINGPFWSLAVEIWFSAAFPVLLLGMARYGMVRSVVAVAAVALALRVVGAYFPFDNVHANPVKDFVLARMDDFLVGMVVAWLYAKGRLPRINAAALCGFAAVLLALTAWAWDLRVQGLMPRALVALLNNSAQLGFAALLVACLTPNAVSRLFSIWGLRLLGVMCFSIYCWHGLLITPALRADPFSVSLQLQFWMLLLALSALTFRYVEFPQEKSLRKLFQLRPLASLGGRGQGGEPPRPRIRPPV